MQKTYDTHHRKEAVQSRRCPFQSDGLVKLNTPLYEVAERLCLRALILFFRTFPFLIH